MEAPRHRPAEFKNNKIKNIVCTMWLHLFEILENANCTVTGREECLPVQWDKGGNEGLEEDAMKEREGTWASEG